MKGTVSKQMTKFGNEASRRLYRGAADAARKLDQRLAQGSSLTELFSSEITDLRNRLKEFCERLMFSDPVEYGKKAEDLLWRKVYYDFFLRCKQNRKKFLESEYHRSSLVSHLLAGIGFYHHLLLRIQTELQVDLEGKVDVPLLWHLKGVKKERWKKYRQSAANDENVQNWAEQASHRILIYLGDLERYIGELDDSESNHLAERYYQQAFCINSHNGTPHNQLGSLHSNRFDSAYHYMRSLSCQEKFDGSDKNLGLVFERNEEVMKQLYSPDSINKESLKCSRFLSRFLKLCQMFYSKPCENYSSEIYCQDILKEFDITLNCSSFDPVSSVEESSFLTDDMIFKVVIMSLMCVRKLHDKSHSDASVATAFTLALFSYVVQKTNQRLLYSIHNLKPLEHQTNGYKIENEKNISKQLSVSKDKLTDTSAESDLLKENISKKPPSKRIGLKKFSAHHLRTLRRRRKMSSTSQDDSELSDGDMTDLPESDEELLNSDVSQTGSCSTESLSENEDDLLVEENDFENEGENEGNSDNSYIFTNGSSTIHNGTNLKVNGTSGDIEKTPPSNIDCILDDPDITTEKLLSILKKNGILPCLKILTDWLRINEDVLSACAESSQFLLTCLIQLLNMLLKIEDKLIGSKEQFLKLKRMDENWKQKYPLPEDTTLQNFSLLKEIHSSLSFDVKSRRELSPSSQVFLRLQCLLSFGKCLIKASESSVEYDSEKKKYYFNLCNKVKGSSKDEAGVSKLVNHDLASQRQYIMRSMAHLWLKAEVNNLETLVEGVSTPQLSPYLVADTSVLCSHLSALKSLVIAKRFIVVVPLVVIASLDNLKKESMGAREAIRWLESELRKGCRYIRAQHQIEKCNLVPLKYPKKKDKEAWDFFQILECCNYLVQKQASGKTDCHLVTLLVGTLYNLPENAIALAQSIDVTIEVLENFLSKWRSSSKNPG